MANTVKMKRSSVAAKVPATTDLQLGELAINTTDGRLYSKKNVSSVDSIIEFLSTDSAFKTDVVAATTASITLSGAQNIDGVSCAVGDRVLVKDQGTATENGIYIVASGSWTRATDADTAAELAGAVVAVSAGTSNGGLVFTTNFKATNALGTDAMSWSQINGAVTYGKIQNVSATDRLLGRSSAGAGVIEEITCTAAGRALLDDADAAAQRATLGLVIGTNVQAYDAELAAIAGLVSVADRLPYFTGSGTAALATFTAAGRNLLDDADAAAQRTTLELGTAATMSGPAGAIVGTTDTQTLTNKTLTDPAITGAIIEDVYTIVDGAAFEIDPSNGTLQNVTLGADRTPKATNFQNGESITLRIKDGTSVFRVFWTDATFGGSGVVWVGGTAPTLDATNWTVVVLWKEGGQVYGKYIGTVA